MAEAVRRVLTMADAKDNFKGALYDMFGVGGGGSERPVSNKPAPQKNPKSSNEPPITPIKPIMPVKKNPDPSKQPVMPAPTALGSNKTYLAAGTVFKGDLYSEGDVEIAGDFEGNIVSKGVVVLHVSVTGNITAAELQLDHCHLNGDINVTESMIVGDGSYIRGSIFAKDAVIMGKVDGNITAKESIDLRATAIVNGDLTAKLLSCARNARLVGRMSICPDMHEETPVERPVAVEIEEKTED